MSQYIDIVLSTSRLSLIRYHISFVLLLAVASISIGQESDSYNQYWLGVNNDYVDAMVMNDSSHLFICGSLEDSIVIDTIVIKSISDVDFFLAKLDSSGNVIWTQSGGGEFDDYADAIGIDSDDNVFVGGRYKDAIVFGDSTFSHLNNLFLAKYSSAGDLEWGTCFGGISEAMITSLVLDTLGNCYVSGYHRGKTNINDNFHHAVGKKDGFLIKFSTDGHINWYKLFGGTENVIAHDLISDDSLNIYAVVEVNGNVSIGDSLLSIGDTPEIVFVKVFTDGSIKRIYRSEANMYLAADVVVVDTMNRYYSAGYYLAVDSLSEDMVMPGQYELYLTKMVGLELDTVYFKDTICDEDRDIFIDVRASGGVSPILYSIDDGESYHEKSFFDYLELGTYRVMIKDDYNRALGDTLTFSVYESPNVELLGDKVLYKNQSLTLSVDSIHPVYEWSNGSTDHSITLNGADFAPGVYIYRIEVMGINGCVNADTIHVTVKDEEFIKATIFPNPASDLFYIDINSMYVEQYSFELYNSSGQIVRNFYLNNPEDNFCTEFDVSALRNGMYFLKILADDQKILYKVLVN